MIGHLQVCKSHERKHMFVLIDNTVCLLFVRANILSFTREILTNRVTFSVYQLRGFNHGQQCVKG